MLLCLFHIPEKRVLCYMQIRTVVWKILMGIAALYIMYRIVNIMYCLLRSDY
jgi:hypothetical protein